jgi:hypothetical protein
MKTYSTVKLHERTIEITDVNVYSKSFDFLAEEPEIYSSKDIKHNKYRIKVMHNLLH